MTIKEQTIINYFRNKIITTDKEINIVGKIDEPLILILDNVLSYEECDTLIDLAKKQNAASENRQISRS